MHYYHHQFKAFRPLLIPHLQNTKPEDVAEGGGSRTPTPCIRMRRLSSSHLLAHHGPICCFERVGSSRLVIFPSVDFEKVVHDDQEHGQRAQEDGQRVQRRVGYHLFCYKCYFPPILVRFLLLWFGR